MGLFYVVLAFLHRVSGRINAYLTGFENFPHLALAYK
jgi:hypothetical protein